jgi:hypothetical protein
MTRSKTCESWVSSGTAQLTLQNEGEKFLAGVHPQPPDVVLLSSDGVRYPAHRRNLEVHSQITEVAEAIEPSATAPMGQEQLETLRVQEAFDVLELLLQFMYPHPQPNLKAEPFPRIAALMETMERYGVYAITSRGEEALGCVIRLNGSLEIFAHY